MTGESTAISADGSVPPWLDELGVKSGGYFIDSKARGKRAMTSKMFSPAARIHICIGLATMGFQQELAVKMKNGKRLPLTPADICAAHPSPKAERSTGMTELETWGLGKCEGSTKGGASRHGWAIPRSIDAKEIVIARDDNLSWCPAELAMPRALPARAKGVSA